MIKTMKSKSIIGAALAAMVTLGVTTSCQDMFDIESSRVIVEKNHNLDSSADSAYSTLGVLQAMRQVADRYIILGEVRGDLLEINEYSKTSIRNLAEFNFEDENEYLNVRDYYAIINNCNYVLEKMDTTLTHNNERVMIDEYAALIGIRAWTYLQLAINYGEVPFYLTPITSVAEAEKEYPMYGIKEIAAELIPDLEAYKDYDLPALNSVASTNPHVYPPLQLVLGDYYLWSGDYANACAVYLDYMTTHPDFDNSQYDNAKGFMSLNGGRVISSQRGSMVAIGSNSTWIDYMEDNVTENLAYITLETSSAEGTVSGLGSLFTSADMTHSLNPSTYLSELAGKQAYIDAEYDEDGNVNGYKVNGLAGDVRNKYYLATPSFMEDRENQLYDKFIFNNSNGTTNVTRINIYRRAIVYLRAAEALNALAQQVQADTITSRSYALNAFYLLKDAYKVFFPNGHQDEKELREKFIGVHARGCGDVRVDDQYFVLKPAVVAKRLGKLEQNSVLTDSAVVADRLLSFNDTIEYIDELIIDELALESAVEGNRFGDLIRFAKRREAWGDVNYRDFLANRVASRKGAEAFDDELYQKLANNENLWYLPLK